MAMNKTTVGEYMTRDVTTITADLKVDVAIETMRSSNVRRLPVVSRVGDRVIGIITLADAEAAMPRGASFMGAAEEIPEIKEVMTDDPYMIGPTETLGRAAQLMVNHKIGALPVVEDGRIVGIITESDLFRFIVKQFQEDGATGA